MRIRTICGLWLPLAVSFEMMMLEGPAVQSAMGRLPDPALSLAAWGLTFSLSLLIESPVIMLLSTAIALVKDADSYVALRKFTLSLCLFCTVLTGLVAFTPLFDLIAVGAMNQPQPIVQAARPALQMMLFWAAAIAWRRFYQGILVRHGYTRLMTWGTLFRLIATVAAAAGLAHWGKLPGAQVAGIALMIAVLTEAIATTAFALPVVRRDVLSRHRADDPPLTQRAIFQFHLPLAATTILILLTPPLTSAALAHLDAKEATLAAWPVVSTVLLVIRGWGLALQEITIALARNPEARPALRIFAWIVGLISSAITLLIAATPLLDLYLNAALHLPPPLRPFVHLGVLACFPLPLLTALGSWVRGALVAAGATHIVYRGMGVNLATHGALLGLGVALRLPGMTMAAGAVTLAAFTEYLYLARRAARLPESE